jgi:serine/threonine protein kinase
MKLHCFLKKQQPKQLIKRKRFFAPQMISQRIQCSELNLFYRLQTHLGKGAFASVNKARHKVTGEQFAIKTYNNKKLEKFRASCVIENEIKILGQLEHRDVVGLKEVVHGRDLTHLVL